MFYQVMTLVLLLGGCLFLKNEPNIFVAAGLFSIASAIYELKGNRGGER